MSGKSTIEPFYTNPMPDDAAPINYIGVQLHQCLDNLQDSSAIQTTDMLDALGIAFSQVLMPTQSTSPNIRLSEIITTLESKADRTNILAVKKHGLTVLEAFNTRFLDNTLNISETGQKAGVLEVLEKAKPSMLPGALFELCKIRRDEAKEAFRVSQNLPPKDSGVRQTQQMISNAEARKQAEAADLAKAIAASLESGLPSSPPITMPVAQPRITSTETKETKAEVQTGSYNINPATADPYAIIGNGLHDILAQVRQEMHGKASILPESSDFTFLVKIHREFSKLLQGERSYPPAVAAKVKEALNNLEERYRIINTIQDNLTVKEALDALFPPTQLDEEDWAEQYSAQLALDYIKPCANTAEMQAMGQLINTKLEEALESREQHQTTIEEKGSAPRSKAKTIPAAGSQKDDSYRYIPSDRPMVTLVGLKNLIQGKDRADVNKFLSEINTNALRTVLYHTNFGKQESHQTLFQYACEQHPHARPNDGTEEGQMLADIRRYQRDCTNREAAAPMLMHNTRAPRSVPYTASSPSTTLSPAI